MEVTGRSKRSFDIATGCHKKLEAALSETLFYLGHFFIGQEVSVTMDQNRYAWTYFSDKSS